MPSSFERLRTLYNHLFTFGKWESSQQRLSLLFTNFFGSSFAVKISHRKVIMKQKSGYLAFILSGYLKDFETKALNHFFELFFI